MMSKIEVKEGRKIKKIARYLKSYLPPIISCNLSFLKNYGRLIKSKNPTLFDEKLMLSYVREYCKSDFVAKCADKYLAREIVADLIGKEFLIPLIGVYRNVNEIKWDKLPNQFVIKCNHGSGYNIIVRDKEKEDKEKIVKKINYWLGENYGRISCELQYGHIKPKIIVEEMIGEKDRAPADYKFMCSRGKVLYCLVVSDRGKDTKKICVDSSFKDTGYIENANINEFEKLKPSNYKKMWEIAEKLSEQFPVVRIDLYEVSGKIYFGEFTFTPHGMIHKYFPIRTQQLLGSMVSL